MLLDTQWPVEDRLDIDTVAIADVPRFGLDERTLGVVALSLKDGLRSVLPSTRMSRLFTRLFGLRPSTPLADPRLEDLRRYCVLSRYRHAQASGVWPRLRDAGYTRTDRDLIDALLIA
jgi:hypothetical protein